MLKIKDLHPSQQNEKNYQIIVYNLQRTYERPLKKQTYYANALTIYVEYRALLVHGKHPDASF